MEATQAMKADTVVVIGSNSFSGSDFVELLLSETEARVIGVSRSPEKGPEFLPYLSHPRRHRFQFVRLDLNRDMASLQQLLSAVRPAFVVNFASQSEVAPSWDTPEQWMQTNAVSTAALANFLRRSEWLRRYLHISTPEVYGTCTGAVTEDAAFNPSTPYAASRAAAEHLLRGFIREYGFPCVFVRSANVYGAHQQLHKIIPRTAIYLRLGRRVMLHGGGTQRRSFIHIRDVSRGELQALLHGRQGAAYHFATDAMVPIAELVRNVCDLMAADFAASTMVSAPRPGQDAAYTLDTTRARGELGWSAAIDLAAGLRHVIDWIERDWPRLENASLEYVHRP